MKEGASRPHIATSTVCIHTSSTHTTWGSASITNGASLVSRLTMNQEQFDKVKNAAGFIAALDQSGGSTPKALRLYGIDENAYSNDEEMFDLVHEMRTRIITSPGFGGDRILGAILFEDTMDREIEGRPPPTTSGRSSGWCRSSRSTRAWPTKPTARR